MYRLNFRKGKREHYSIVMFRLLQISFLISFLFCLIFLPFYLLFQLSLFIILTNCSSKKKKKNTRSEIEFRKWVVSKVTTRGDTISITSQTDFAFLAHISHNCRGVRNYSCTNLVPLPHFLKLNFWSFEQQTLFLKRTLINVPDKQAKHSRIILNMFNRILNGYEIKYFQNVDGVKYR